MLEAISAVQQVTQEHIKLLSGFRSGNQSAVRRLQ
jgi:hypothetical protein